VGPVLGPRATAIILAAILLIGSLGSPFSGVGVHIDAGPMQPALKAVSAGLARPYC
jgi:anti-sigma factor RsiW